jgi:hypothetical protein
MQRKQNLEVIVELLNKKNDVLMWKNEDVLKWLSLIQLEMFSLTFKKYQIDGYTLFQMKEADLEVLLN